MGASRRTVYVAERSRPYQAPPDPASGLPLYLQVARLLQEEIASGELEVGGDVPSLRAMASRLRLNVHTVAKAYQGLEADGVLVRRRGEPYRVATGAAVARQLLREDVEALLDRAASLGVGAGEVLELVEEAARLHLERIA